MSAAEEEPIPIERKIALLQNELKDEAKALSKLASALGPLTRAKTYEDLANAPAVIDKVEAKIQGLPHIGPRGGLVLLLVRKDLNARKKNLREQLSRDLNKSCKSRGLKLRVIRREEPVEIRIAPFGVLIDREKGQAKIQFAKQSVETCAATAPAILDAYERALKSFTTGFQRGRFFQACHRAWLAARGAGYAGSSDRVEILDFLPYLAIQLQTPSFRINPSERNYKGYSRARFAFDLLQLRNAGGLTHDGWRLNLGVATGTTASKKNRSVWIEDEDGNGEFKLTIFFTNAEGKR